MEKLSFEDIEFIKILAFSDSTLIQKGMTESTMMVLETRIGPILREYYIENTQQIGSKWTDEFTKSGITEDQGKAAIACARRLGIEII